MQYCKKGKNNGWQIHESRLDVGWDQWGSILAQKDGWYSCCLPTDVRMPLLENNVIREPLKADYLMFACAALPDHRKAFRELIREEIDHQTKRLRNHCALALFCGSNEVHWLFNPIDNPRWGIEFQYEHSYGMHLMNRLAKEIMHANCPEIIYWNSSPYGGSLPNDDSAGDIHHWPSAFMSQKMEERIEPKDYDKIRAKFVSEYGYVGPCCRETIAEYLDRKDGLTEPDRGSDLWWWHSNVFEKGTVHTAIEKNYVDHADHLTLDDYITYGGMVHGLMYGYSLEAMKFKEHCYGSLLWMYNDAWGEVGWTIIDYYLRRKIPFYAVKRALAHRRFALRVVDGQVVLQGINDLPETVEVTGQFGYVSFDGSVKELRPVSFRLRAGERSYVLKEALPDRDYASGTIALYVDGDEIDNAWLRMDDMRRLHPWKNQAICVSDVRDGEDRILTVRSESFAHGVHIDENLKCTDNYFDLLPGEEKTFRVEGAGDRELPVKTVTW